MLTIWRWQMSADRSLHQQLIHRACELIRDSKLIQNYLWKALLLLIPLLFQPQLNIRLCRINAKMTKRLPYRIQLVRLSS